MTKIDKECYQNKQFDLCDSVSDNQIWNLFSFKIKNSGAVIMVEIF